MLEQFEYINNETDDIVGKAWYYGTCVDLILDTGMRTIIQSSIIAPCPKSSVVDSVMCSVKCKICVYNRRQELCWKRSRPPRSLLISSKLT